jgi:glycosyltransferase involved in cell wall biosynthesis
MALKRQGLAFQNCKFVVQLHGVTRWTIECNKELFVEQDQLKVDYLEKKSIQWADHVVSPTEYLRDWCAKNGYFETSSTRVVVIPNCMQSSGEIHSEKTRQQVFPTEIIMFGRHEERKGFTIFCDAISRIHEDLSAKGITVTFLGRLGTINGLPSGLVLTNKASSWRCRVRILPSLDRAAANEYLRLSERSLVVVPSPEENAPYTVLEVLSCQLPIITSSRGGARELIGTECHTFALCEMEPKELAARLLSAVNVSIPIATPARNSRDVETMWQDFHRQNLPPDSDTKSAFIKKRTKPKVVLGITHYERPEKLVGALISAARQDYENLEIVVVDDGSESERTLARLTQIEDFLRKIGGRLLRRSNGYLGAARNTIARETSSDYLLFLDDDDLAFPGLVSKLVHAATHTDADVTNCINLYMEEERRTSDAILWPESFPQKPSYIPTGGPLSLSAYQNCLGAATALIKRSTFDAVGGYTEERGVGFEDYELYVRLLQAGARIEIVPLPLYLYEVGRPSMASTTNLARNHRRVVDAIDYSRNGEAWKDLVALRAGFQAKENRVNRVSWEVQVSPNKDLLAEIIRTNGVTSQHVFALANYAEKIGSPYLASCWRASSVARVESLGELAATTRLFFEDIRSLEAPIDDMMLSSDIMLDLYLGRCDMALQRLAQDLERTKFFTLTNAMCFWSLMRKMNAVEIKSLATEIIRIRDYPVVPSGGAVFLASCIVASWLIGDNSMFLLSWSELEKIEAENYLAENADVASSISAGAHSCALEHYVESGFAEGRKGFFFCCAVCDVVAEKTGAKVTPWMMRGRALTLGLFQQKRSGA